MIPGGHADEATRIAATARATAKELRSLVLSYPDLAARLTEPPIGYKRADQWTGYVPPAFDADVGGVVKPNRSPIRAALLEIVTEAAARADTRQASA